MVAVAARNASMLKLSSATAFVAAIMWNRNRNRMVAGTA
jgi:hypothetical protein